MIYPMAPLPVTLSDI